MVDPAHQPRRHQPRARRRECAQERWPISCATCASGHYDNTVFHRVIDGFMIQGGGLGPGLQPEAARTPPIDNEAGNGLKNQKYTVAMARTSDPHSATAQFFINVADNAFLDHKGPTPQGWGYCVFGQVVAGKDVVDAHQGCADRQQRLATRMCRPTTS